MNLQIIDKITFFSDMQVYPILILFYCPPQCFGSWTMTVSPIWVWLNSVLNYGSGYLNILLNNLSYLGQIGCSLLQFAYSLLYQRSRPIGLCEANQVVNMKRMFRGWLPESGDVPFVFDFGGIVSCTLNCWFCAQFSKIEFYHRMLWWIRSDFLDH